MNGQVKIALKYALISFFVSTALFLVYYIINPDLIFQWFTYLIPAIIIGIFFVVKAMHAHRKNLGGRINFLPAWLVGCMTWIFGLIIGGVFNIVFEMIDPEFTDFAKDSAIEMTENMMERFGAPESSIEEAIIAMEEQDFSAKGTFFKNLINNGIFGIVFSAFVALIFHLLYKRRPEDDVVIEE